MVTLIFMVEQSLPSILKHRIKKTRKTNLFHLDDLADATPQRPFGFDFGDVAYSLFANLVSQNSVLNSTCPTNVEVELQSLVHFNFSFLSACSMV